MIRLVTLIDTQVLLVPHAQFAIILEMIVYHMIVMLL